MTWPNQATSRRGCQASVLTNRLNILLFIGFVKDSPVGLEGLYPTFSVLSVSPALTADAGALFFPVSSWQMLLCQFLFS